MKASVSFFYVCLFFALTATNCKKDRVSNPIDQLPPVTQTGANTFGCLVNGQAFLPGGLSLAGGSLNCEYQYIYPDSTNGYIFSLSAGKRLWKSNALIISNCDNVTSIGIVLDSLVIKEGVSYDLVSQKRGNASGQFFIVGDCYSDSKYTYHTLNTINGNITFTKFDQNNQIASGTFWFNAINAENDTVKILDGRFDVHYTR